MRKLIPHVALIASLMLPAAAAADTLTFQVPTTTNPITDHRDFDDLDHYYMYAWRLTGVDNLIGSANHITGARLFFKNIDNWDSNPNRLYAHLLDTALTKSTSSQYYMAQGTSDGGVVSHQLTRAQDTTVDTNNVANMVDDFKSNGGVYTTAGQKLVATGTANTQLGRVDGISSWIVGGKSAAANTGYSYSFTSAKEDFTYVFTDAQILALNAYLDNGGDFAIGLDPDCHFENDYIKLYLDYGPDGTPTQQTVVPEPATMTLVGLGLASFYTRKRRNRK